MHCHGVPSGAVVVPERVFPNSFLSNTISSFRASSSFGEMNVRVPFKSSILGRGRACPQRLTIRALNTPSSCRISNHEGYSRSGAFRVRSQRPRKGLTDTVAAEEAVFCEYAPVKKNQLSITEITTAFRSFMRRVLLL